MMRKSNTLGLMLCREAPYQSVSELLLKILMYSVAYIFDSSASPQDEGFFEGGEFWKRRLVVRIDVAML